MAITKVQSVTATVQSSSFNIALSGVALGNTLTLQMTYERTSTSTAPATPTDSNGTLLVGYAPAPEANGGAYTGAAVWYESNAAAGTHTITVGAADVFANVTLTEWSGLATSAAADQTGIQATATNAQTSTVTANGATAQASELALAVLSIAAGTGVSNAAITDPPSGWVSLLVYDDTATWVAGEHAYQVLSSIGTPSATWNWTDTSVTGHQAVLFTLKGASSSNVTVAATGVAGTSGTGTVAKSAAVAVTGNAGTSATGTVKPSTAVAPTGNAGTSSTGTVKPSTAVAATGDAATGTPGTVAPGAAVAPTGVAATSAVGSVAGSLTVTLNGVDVTGAAGIVVVPGNVTVSLTGVAATGRVGTITYSIPGSTVVLPPGFVTNHMTGTFKASQTNGNFRVERVSGQFKR